MLRIVLFSLMLTTAARGMGQSIDARQQLQNLDKLPDLTQQLQQQIDNMGLLRLEGRQYFRITKPLVFDLAKLKSTKVTAAGGATLIMDGAGPAIHLIGTHEGTASPKSFQPATWNERMPLVNGIEILGAHPEADGIRLERTVAATINSVSIRWCRHGIHLVDRNRNVTISDCHLYENSDIGLYLDDVNLHQINVGNSHVSYNRGGGIVVRNGNVRNIQVHGCDIEANMPADETATRTANILLDVSGSTEDKSKSIAEVAITGCTIQHSANYSGNDKKTVAPGGANIRLAGKAIYPIDSVTITGNVLSDTTTNIDIKHAMDVTIGNNTFFAPRPANLTVSKSHRVVVTGNTFHPRQFVRPGTIRFVDSHDCVLANSVINRCATATGAVNLEGCTGFSLSGLSISECDSGIVLTGCAETTIANCRIARTTAGGKDISADESNRLLLFSGNAFGGSVSIASSAMHEK